MTTPEYEALAFAVSPTLSSYQESATSYPGTRAELSYLASNSQYAVHIERNIAPFRQRYLDAVVGFCRKHPTVDISIALTAGMNCDAYEEADDDLHRNWDYCKAHVASRIVV